MPDAPNIAESGVTHLALVISGPLFIAASSELRREMGSGTQPPRNSEYFKTAWKMQFKKWKVRINLINREEMLGINNGFIKMRSTCFKQ